MLMYAHMNVGMCTQESVNRHTPVVPDIQYQTPLSEDLTVKLTYMLLEAYPVSGAQAPNGRLQRDRDVTLASFWFLRAFHFWLSRSLLGTGTDRLLSCLSMFTLQREVLTTEFQSLGG